KGQGKDAAFLRDVRDGACGLFSTVLSPDYNAAHRDHFHLDQAERGATGWRACR
ncbi:MAG: extensin family protein, partial [Sphingobium yanoikuyae]